VTTSVNMGPNLLGQGIVLSANKTAHAPFSRCSRDRSRVLRAQRLRLIRALREAFSLDKTRAMPMLATWGNFDIGLPFDLEMRTSLNSTRSQRRADSAATMWFVASC